MTHYHDVLWGRALPRSGGGSGRALYKQLLLQTFQSGLSWTLILKKEEGFASRFEGYDYTAVARWDEERVAAALADPGIVRNRAKVAAAVSNAKAACALDAAGAEGFEAFCWRVGGNFPASERLLALPSRSGTHMRSTPNTDFSEADGVHPTVSVVAAVKAFKAAGFKFVGPAVMLSFLQASGFVNHHARDCAAWAPAEAAYAAATAGGTHAGGAAADSVGGARKARADSESGAPVAKRAKR
jgi:DNA-3-methyladenine glycosylase I